MTTVEEMQELQQQMASVAGTLAVKQLALIERQNQLLEAILEQLRRADVTIGLEARVNRAIEHARSHPVNENTAIQMCEILLDCGNWQGVSDE